jgi:hypothetical protein
MGCLLDEIDRGRATDGALSLLVLTSTASRRSTTATAIRSATGSWSRSLRGYETNSRDEHHIRRIGGEELAWLLPAASLGAQRLTWLISRTDRAEVGRC